MALGRQYVAPLLDFIALMLDYLTDNEKLSQVGDPIEALAVANVFGDHGIYIGSVTSEGLLDSYRESSSC